MKSWVHASLVVACSLAGSSSLPEPGEVKQCLTHILECKDLDHLVRPEHASTPLVLVCFSVVLIGLPTVLVPSKMRDAGLFELCKCCLLAFSASLVGKWVARPMLGYALVLHASARALCSVSPDFLVGGVVYASLKYLCAWALCAWAAKYGPGISIVQWVDASQTLCAFQCHLLGVLFSGMADELLSAFFSFFFMIYASV